MFIPDDVSDYNPPSLTPSRAPTQATEPAGAPCREPTEGQILEVTRNKAEYTARYAELQASYMKDPEAYVAARLEAEENRRLAEQLTDQIEQYKYEQWSEKFDAYQQKYDARQAAKQKALGKCDYTLVDKLGEDDTGHIHSVGNRLVNLGMKLGVGVILSFCQLGESSLLTFPESSTLEEGQFVDTYQELVSIAMAHYLQPQVQFAALEQADEALSQDTPQNESHSTTNLEDLINPATVELFSDYLPVTIDTCIPTEVANDSVPPIIPVGDQERDSDAENRFQPSSGVSDPETCYLPTNPSLDGHASFSEPLHKADDMDYSGLADSSHPSYIPSWGTDNSSRCNETEQGLWNTLTNILSTHGLEIGLHFSPCISLIPPLPSPLPLGDSEVAMQLSLIFAQLFALCWIRGFHVELHCLPSDQTCRPPVPSAPAEPFVLKSIPIQRGWWADQVGIQKRARGASVDPIKFSHASTGKRRWSPYPVMKSCSFTRTILVR